jgi:hypothetical protein
MGLFSRIAGTPEARATYRDAKQRLAEASEGREETDETVAANDAVVAAEKNIPWWAR